MPPAIALTIAGSDPSGGAGIQADLKTFHQFRVYGEAVIALLTVQNTREVRRVKVLPAELVMEQLEAVLDDLRPAAAKTGALGSAEVVRAIAAAAEQFDFPLVVDPVMISKHGAPLILDDARAALAEDLLPRAYLLMPNTHEAEALTGFEVRTRTDMRRAAEALHRMGAQHVLLKGGHAEGDATDLLFTGSEFIELPSERYDTVHTHGTGCTYSAAITAELAKGEPIVKAVRLAKRFIADAIRTAPGLGGGSGPVNHFAPVE
jgi:hydroxymethylpyrimidine/phosphomethylpyrimidine kinase